MRTREQARASHRRDNPMAYAPLSDAALVIAARMWRDGKGRYEIADVLRRHESVVARQIEEIRAEARTWTPMLEAAE